MKTGQRYFQREKKRRLLWILFDESNGDYPVKNYLWWFPTRAAAEAHRASQHADPNNARLSEPVPYVRRDE